MVMFAIPVSIISAVGFLSFPTLMERRRIIPEGESSVAAMLSKFTKETAERAKTIPSSFQKFLAYEAGGVSGIASCIVDEVTHAYDRIFRAGDVKQLENDIAEQKAILLQRETYLKELRSTIPQQNQQILDCLKGTVPILEEATQQRSSSLDSIEVVIEKFSKMPSISVEETRKVYNDIINTLTSAPNLEGLIAIEKQIIQTERKLDALIKEKNALDARWKAIEEERANVAQQLHGKVLTRQSSLNEIKTLVKEATTPSSSRISYDTSIEVST